MARPASFNVADITSGTLARKKNKKNSQSPIRKFSTSTLTYEVGKKTLQRKVQKILRKRGSSKNIVTQNNKEVEGDDDTQSTLKHDEASPYIANATDSGDDLKARESRLSSAFESPKAVEKKIIPKSCTPVNTSAKGNNCASTMNFEDVRPLNERRDSGLSSCSCLTSTPISTSAPVTPSNHEKFGGDLHFQYPNNPSLKMLSNTGNSFSETPGIRVS